MIGLVPTPGLVGLDGPRMLRDVPWRRKPPRHRPGWLDWLSVYGGVGGWERMLWDEELAAGWESRIYRADGAVRGRGWICRDGIAAGL